PSLFICSMSFFFMATPAPSSTLFPYTTLFRSHRGYDGSSQGGSDGVDGGPFSIRGSGESCFHDVDPEALELQRDGHRVDVVEAGDRKSTRLNSSHLVISYAVFCLKKKKKKP